MGDVNGTKASEVVQTLKKEFGNVVLQPGEQRYEDENGKFWNRDNSDIRPAAIVTPSTPQETG